VHLRLVPKGKGAGHQTWGGWAISLCMPCLNVPAGNFKSGERVRQARLWQGTRALQSILQCCTLVSMVTLADIEAAVVSLKPAEKQELMLFLASRLRAEGGKLPEPRVFSADEMARWIAEDEADMRRLREQP